MAKPEERMNMISSAIREQVEQQSRDIIRQANDYRESQLLERTKQVSSRMEEEVGRAISALQHKKLSDISRAEQESYQTLLCHREALIGQVFDGVREDLASFAATPAYREWLLELLGQRASLLAGRQDVVVLLRREDLALEREISQLLPGCTLRQHDAVAPGGFILCSKSARIRIDETLCARLDELRPWFLSQCGLRVNE